MVSLWPWKADETASFEKTLSTLSSRISKETNKLNSLRARSRRYKALWTLYTSVTYIFGTLILVLVTGWQRWGVVEYGVVVGSPVIIYLVRMAFSSYYNYRLSSTQAHIDDLSQQREAAIKKFKTATKYDSTQKLLEKYGAGPSPISAISTGSNATSGLGQKRDAAARNQSQRPRTNIPPPPTANIRRSDAVSSPQAQLNTKLDVPMSPVSASPRSPPAHLAGPAITEEFAANAFSEPSSDSRVSRQYSFPGPPPFSNNALTSASASSTMQQQPHHQSHWYDRFLDVLLGDDEKHASNRIALICSNPNCRLVNGQAPPGVRSLDEVGKWRCGGCGAWNGVESEMSKIIEEVASGNESPGMKHEEQVERGSRASSAEAPRQTHKNIPRMRQKKSKLDGTVDEGDTDEVEGSSHDRNLSIEGSLAEDAERDGVDNEMRDDTEVGSAEDEDEVEDEIEATRIAATPPARSTRSRSSKGRK